MPDRIDSAVMKVGAPQCLSSKRFTGRPAASHASNFSLRYFAFLKTSSKLLRKISLYFFLFRAIKGLQFG